VSQRAGASLHHDGDGPLWADDALGPSTGMTGCPAFNTFCLMLLLDVTIVGGKLVCWRIGGRISRSPLERTHAERARTAPRSSGPRDGRHSVP
jgi:hypothetical protein